MVDYKAPSGDVCADYETNGVSSDYVGQVHHYLILAMAAGVEIDEMAIMVHDPRSLMITPYPVAYDKDLAKSIMSAAGVFWDEFVMKGELPEKIVAPQLMLEDEAVIDLGYTLGAFKVIEAEVQSRISETQERISLLAATGTASPRAPWNSTSRPSGARAPGRKPNSSR